MQKLIRLVLPCFQLNIIEVKNGSLLFEYIISFQLTAIIYHSFALNNPFKTGSITSVSCSHWGKRHFKHEINQRSNIYQFSIAQLALFMAVLICKVLNNHILINLHNQPGQKILSESFHISKETSSSIFNN